MVAVNVHQLHLKLRGSFLVCRGGERGEEGEVVECTKKDTKRIEDIQDFVIGGRDV